MKAHLFTLLLLSYWFNSNAQDLRFSQAYANGKFLNPALTGSEEQAKLNFSYRKQWAGQAAQFNTYAAGFENTIGNQNSAYGFQIIKDVAGDNILQSTLVDGFYAYKLNLNNDWVLRSGIQFGLGQRNLNVNNLVFEDQLDSRDGIIRSSSSEQINSATEYYPDFGAGFMLLSSTYYAGFALHHLNTPTVSFQGEKERIIERKYTLQAGAKLEYQSYTKKNAYYSPNLIIQQQGESRDILFGNYLQYKALGLGMWYRVEKDFILAIAFSGKNFRFAYSQDINTQNYGGNTAQELSVVYFFNSLKGNKKGKSNFSKVFCPQF